MAPLNHEWPSWLENTSDPARVWVRDEFLKKLYREILKHHPEYTPATLLSSTDQIKVTALRHYKQTVAPSHEAARIDIRLDLPNKQPPFLDLSIVCDRTSGDAGKDMRRLLIPLGYKFEALDRADFCSPSKADERLLSDRAEELTNSGADVSGQYFNILFLAFVLQTLSSRHPQYHLYSTMCYWYAGSTLDCLHLALHKAKQEAESHITGSSAGENSDYRGRAKFAEFWKFKSPSFYKSQVPYVLHSSPVDNNTKAEKLTEEFMGVVTEAETKTNTFRASLIFGDEDLAQPENRKDFLRRYLVADVPIEVGKKGDGYRLSPKPSPGFILMDKLALGDDNAGMVTEARELFYKENRFLVSLNALDAFWNGRYQRYELDDLVRSSIRHITIAITTEDDSNLYPTMDLLKELDPGVNVRIVVLDFGDSKESKAAIARVSEKITPWVTTLFGRFTNFKVHKQLLQETGDSDADNDAVARIFNSL